MGSVATLPGQKSTTHRLHYIESKYNYGGAYGNDGYGLWFWEQRKGMAYQADIEAHVAAWRDTPRDLLTWGGAGSVVVAMSERHYRFEMKQTDNGFAARFAPGEWTKDKEAPVAVGRAALEVLGVEV